MNGARGHHGHLPEVIAEEVVFKSEADEDFSGACVVSEDANWLLIRMLVDVICGFL